MNTIQIEKFINLVNANEQTRQPELRITMNDAKQLRDNISTLLTYVIKKQDEVIEGQKKLSEAQNITIEMNCERFLTRNLWTSWLRTELSSMVGM